MTRIRFAACAALTALSLLALPVPLSAHEGHGKGEVAPYDLDTPRTVSPETAAHIGLKTAEVDFGTVEEVLRLVGVVRPVPDAVAALTTRIAGTVVTVTVQPGDAVLRGQLVAEVDAPQLAQYVYESNRLDSEYYQLLGEVARAESRVDELAVQVQAAADNASIVEAEYQRLSTNDGAVPVNVLSQRQAEAVRARSEAKLREIELTLARRQVESMNKQAQAMRRSREALREFIASVQGIQAPGDSAGPADPDAAAPPGRLGLVRFTAPMQGVVIERRVNGGQGVQAGETLLEVADYSRVQVEGEVPESLLERLGAAAGNPVRIRRASDAQGDPIAGRVRFISPVIDPVKRTAHVIVEADNSQSRLRDGMYVDLSIVLRQEASAVVVPASAMVSDGPMHFVFVKEGDVYRKQDINPGQQDDRVVEILAGLVPGDVVVTRGAYSLTQLRPKAVAPVPAKSGGAARASSSASR